MAQDFAWLNQIYDNFDGGRAASWAQEAYPMLIAGLPLLSAESYREGVPEALMDLRILLERFTPENAEQHAFELCDRIADLRELLEEA